MIQEGLQIKVPLKQVLVKQNRIMKAVKVQQGNTLHGLAAVYGTTVQVRSPPLPQLPLRDKVATLTRDTPLSPRRT